MKKLVDAFLDLPTWQGILLLAGAAALVAIVALIVDKIAWQRGWNECRRHWENKEQARSDREVSERI